MADDQLRVLVVDDHPMFRFGLTAALAAEHGITVIGEAASGATAVAVAGRANPDVVVMDLHLPDMTGVEATRRIVEANPEAGVLILTMSGENESVVAAIRGGARGYLIKDAGPDEIIRGVRAVARGEAIFGSDVATRVLGYLHGVPSAMAASAFPELTAREQEILALIAQGKSNAAIAHKLSLSPKTVRNHISNVFSKLRVADRAEAIVRAREAGLGSS